MVMGGHHQRGDRDKGINECDSTAANARNAYLYTLTKMKMQKVNWKHVNTVILQHATPNKDGKDEVR
jgi:hypothetical protein